MNTDRMLFPTIGSDNRFGKRLKFSKDLAAPLAVFALGE
jgi:hypothetical protein